MAAIGLSCLDTQQVRLRADPDKSWWSLVGEKRG